LSGGQKQRLAIARAVVTRPKILFLDEATSALDTETEKAVTDALYQLKGKITLIVIAHRVSTIMNADKAIYLEAGKIIKDGSIQDIIREMPNFAKNAGLLET
jgi:ATP-binding cassette subfamily C protein